MTEGFSLMDLFFYGIAVYEGYRFAFVPITAKLVDELGGESDKELPFRYKLRLPLALVSLIVMLGFLYYSGGEANMTYSEYHDSGKKSVEGELRNGKEEGKWQYWDENGKLTRIGYFKEGKQDSVWLSFGENKQIIEKDYYKDGELHGISETYFPNGQIELSITYENGVEQGKYILYHETGNVSTEGAMEDGYMAGKWNIYYQDGQLQTEMEYKDEGETMLIWQSFDNLGNPNVVNGNGHYKGEWELEIHEGDVEEGIRVGVWKTYNLEGRLLETGRYDGDGYQVINIWNESGDLVVENGNGHFESSDGTVIGEYKDGYQEGIWNIYNVAKEIVMQVKYEKGKVVETKTGDSLL